MPAGQPFTSLCQQLARPRSAGRVDLHLHTTASDGTYTPDQIVELGRLSGLSALAITDHDTLDAIAPARLAAGAHVEIVAGVEVTTEFQAKELHLLGYFFRPDDKALERALADLRRDRIGRFREMVERLRTLGVHVEGEAAFGPGTTLGRRHLAEMIVKAGRADTVRQAFQRYLGDHGRATVPKRCLPVAEAIALIRGAGGVASWAHPTYDCTRESLQALHELGMEAVEADFPSCRPSRRGALRAWAAELGLSITGGSDCHGPGSPQRTVGACGISSGELEQLRARASTNTRGSPNHAR